MSIPWKPADYSTVSPYLVVADADATIQWLVEVLNAREIRRFTDEAGGIVHAEVRIGDSVVMLGDAVPDVWPPTVSGVHVYVPDVDAVYAHALRIGAESVQAPSQRSGETDRRCGVRDPGGTVWWLASQVTTSD